VWERPCVPATSTVGPDSVAVVGPFDVMAEPVVPGAVVNVLPLVGAPGRYGRALDVSGGVGVAGAVNAGGGAGAAGPWPNCHVHEAVPRDPAGCISPTLPFTTGALEPLRLVAVAAPSTTGNDHSKASDAICPGV